MKGSLKTWIRPTRFPASGALSGLGYDFLAGCSTGTCIITARPLTSMVYTGIISWLLSGLIGRECQDKCSM